MNDFSDQMAKCSNEELLKMTIIEAFKYQEFAIVAAVLELNKRKIPDLEELKSRMISENFKDLANYSDSDLKEYVLSLKFKFKKNDKEIYHILKMGNLHEDKSIAIIEEFDNLVKKNNTDKSDKNKLIGAILFIGGISFTLLTFDSAREGGAYYVAYGAIIFGVIKFFNLV
jgi:hypothetical protein